MNRYHFTESLQELLKVQKNLDDIFDHLGFDVVRPQIVLCYYRNDANLIGALYQHLLTYK